MPVSTSIARNLVPVRFNTDRGFFWDYADREMRFAVARDPNTGTALGAVLADAYARLRAAGKPNADLFRPARAGQFVQMALGQMGESADGAVPALVRSLGHPNAQVRGNAAQALGLLDVRVSLGMQFPAILAAAFGLQDFCSFLWTLWGWRKDRSWN
jgi:hypothetical protein